MKQINALLLITLGSFLSWIPFASEPSPYLPSVGPGPLRFQAPRSPAPAKTPLPPLEIPKPGATNETTVQPHPNLEVSPSVVPPETVTPPPITTPAPPSQANPDLAPPSDPLFPSSAQETVTPQMLLQFFQQPGKPAQTSTSALFPLSFTPPGGTPMPSSTSVYKKE